MLGPISLRVKMFEDSSRNVIARSRRQLLWVLECLTQINVLWLRQHPETPLLYSSGVVYKPDMPGEIFRDIPNILEAGFGDCDCLSCYRTAELRNIGIMARSFIKWRLNDKGGWTYHALTAWPDGRIEDPSLALGMHDGRMFNRPVFVPPE